MIPAVLGAWVALNEARVWLAPLPDTVATMGGAKAVPPPGSTVVNGVPGPPSIHAPVNPVTPAPGVVGVLMPTTAGTPDAETFCVVENALKGGRGGASAVLPATGPFGLAAERGAGGARATRPGPVN